MWPALRKKEIANCFPRERVSARCCIIYRNQLLLHHDGVEGINEAKEWIGSIVSVAETELPPLGADEYYYYQVVGLDVFDTQGSRVGTIMRIWSTPGGDLYVVQGEAKEYLIPVAKEIIEGRRGQVFC